MDTIPYRITRDGIDWEVIEPNDPWSFIGYWGDHQIIYLLKLLEILRAHNPGKLKELLNKELFVYANVPYRIKGHDAIVQNPQDTIDFDHDIEQFTADLVSQKGSDGKLMHVDGKLHRVNLAEKLLLALLTKVSNFIPDAGIWMNTQRPEWNDANNALVGNGVSMVTLCYCYRYVQFLRGVFTEGAEVSLSGPLFRLLQTTRDILIHSSHSLEQGFSASERRHFVDKLGHAGEHYRSDVYAHRVVDVEKVTANLINECLEHCTRYFEATIRSNRGEDGLYHAYNLARFSDG